MTRFDVNGYVSMDMHLEVFFLCIGIRVYDEYIHRKEKWQNTIKLLGVMLMNLVSIKMILYHGAKLKIKNVKLENGKIKIFKL